MPKEYTLIGGNGTVVTPLEVTEDGDYVAGDSRAFNPVKVRTGGGGSSTLAGLTDVDLTNPTDGQTLVYDATSQKWVNGSNDGPFVVLEHVTETANLTYNAQLEAQADIDSSIVAENLPWPFGFKNITVIIGDESHTVDAFLSNSPVTIITTEDYQVDIKGQTNGSPEVLSLAVLVGGINEGSLPNEVSVSYDVYAWNDYAKLLLDQVLG